MLGIYLCNFLDNSYPTRGYGSKNQVEIVRDVMCEPFSQDICAALYKSNAVPMSKINLTLLINSFIFCVARI